MHILSHWGAYKTYTAYITGKSKGDIIKVKKLPVVTKSFKCSGDRTRTCGLWVMSPTSYQLLHPAVYDLFNEYQNLNAVQR